MLRLNAWQNVGLCAENTCAVIVIPNSVERTAGAVRSLGSARIRLLSIPEAPLNIAGSVGIVDFGTFAVLMSVQDCRVVSGCLLSNLKSPTIRRSERTKLKVHIF